MLITYSFSSTLCYNIADIVMLIVYSFNSTLCYNNADIVMLNCI